MRPVRLDLSGFAAFRDPTVVDFTDADYFALTGPTGSGKSTVIDGLTFALRDGAFVRTACTVTRRGDEVVLRASVTGDGFPELRRTATAVLDLACRHLDDTGLPPALRDRVTAALTGLGFAGLVAVSLVAALSLGVAVYALVGL